MLQLDSAMFVSQERLVLTKDCGQYDGSITMKF